MILSPQNIHPQNNRAAQIAQDVFTGKIASMRQIRRRLNNVCCLDDFLAESIGACDMWMTEGGDKAEVEMRNSAEKEKGLSAAEISSPNSPTPKKTVMYNHRKEWTDVKLLQSCRLMEKGRLKVPG